MKPEMTMLEKAISIALKAHTGQKDKAGLDYILHPLRVMMKMKTEQQMITAVLHDVIEDSATTVADLENEGISHEIVKAVKCLTRDEKNETYDQRIEIISRNPLALAVKLADIEDNMDLRRLVGITPDDEMRLKKYNAAWHKLNQIKEN